MYKILLLLSTLIAVQAANVETYIYLKNNDGSRETYFNTPGGARYCYCISQTQTAQINGIEGGDVKLFSTSDCTGNYANGSGKITYNAQWINSVSFGVSGIPSDLHYPICKWYN
ncbi:hypothetical protein FBU30_001663 [Linnemannia zychae]|nr:hypothetical protein FBU30_001663 [Linnemannia zychae]